MKNITDPINTEHLLRFNIKQTSKGKIYCEATCKANTIKDLDEGIALLMKRIEKISTVGDDIIE